MGRMQRDKGRRGEQATATELRAALGENVVVRRGQQSREGRDEPDVVVEGLPIWIEVKSWGARRSWAEHVEALGQATAACASSEHPEYIPLAVVRENRRPPMCVCRLGALLELQERATFGRPLRGPVVLTTWASVLVWLERWVRRETR